MMQKISLKEAEQKVFRTTFQDGLLDIVIGCLILQFAIAPLLSSRLGDFWSSAVFLPLWALVFGILWLVRKSFVAPRLGSVTFAPSRKKKMTRLTTAMVVVNFIALGIGTFFALNFNPSLSWLYPATMGFIVLVMSSLAAYFLECTRLFIYGLLFVFSLIVGEMLFAYGKVSHHGFPLMFGLTSGIIIVTGIVLFLRLLRRYPLPTNQSIPAEKI